MEPFIKAAQHIGAPVEKMLRSAGLPTELTYDDNLLLPEIPCWLFVQSTSRAEGVSNFGLLAGNIVAHQDISALAPLIANCTNLYDLLKRFCVVAPLYSNNNLYIVEDEKHSVRFTQMGNRLVTEDIQVQLFEVLGMIQIVQLAAGTNWRPEDIYFTFEQQADVKNAEELNPSRIHFSQRHPSIAIPRSLLSIPLSLTKMYLESGAANTNDFPMMPSSFAEGLRDAIIPYLGDMKFNKSFAAQITDLHPRTLQRRLAQEDTSYSQVFDQARLMKAATLLKEDDMKLLDISLILGYENASSFTRAFHRWAGVSPREYRYIHAHTEH